MEDLVEDYRLLVERQVYDEDKLMVHISPDLLARLREEYGTLQGWVELDTIAPNLKLLLRRLLRPGINSEE